MRLNFKFSNHFGTAYKTGNLVFTSNGYGLLSPIGNQITIFDLKRDACRTLAINSFHNIRHMALSPNMCMLLAVNEIGEMSIVSLITGSVVSVFSIRHPVTAISFSPDGKFVALAKGHCIMIFFAPSTRRQFNHFELYRVYYGFSDEVTSIDWTDDSRIFLGSSCDTTCRVFSVQNSSKLVVYTLSGHHNPLIGAFFLKNSLSVITVSSDGEACLWEPSVNLEGMAHDEERPSQKVLFRLEKRNHYVSTDESRISALVSAVTFHKSLRILVTGFTSGLLLLHNIPEFTLIGEVKLFSYPINTLITNHSGEWIAAGSEEHGHLAVWEWRSHVSYLKAESHAKQMTSIAYSPNGLYLVTGGYDAKVKVWQIAGGRAVVTFSEHTAAVTGVAFPAQKPKVVISSSLDGTVRAHDLVRYRNFRTFSVPTRPVQFASLAVDSFGSLVAAGGLDSFEAFVWSVKTGLLLTTLSGHTAPISALAFSPDVTSFDIELASVSWDKTLRLWDLNGNNSDEHNPSSLGSLKECVNFDHDILTVSYRNDGKELALALLNGDIAFYDPVTGTELGSISGKRDLGMAQTTNEDLVTPKRLAQARKFQTIAYSADGEHMLAAGDSKYICLYSVPDRLLLKRFEVTCNLSLDGVQEVHDRRRFLANYSTESAQAKALQQSSLPIPANRSGVDRSRREWHPSVRVSSIQFSPTGDAFAATTTEGVLVYSLHSAGIGFSLGSHFGHGQDSFGSWLFHSDDLDERATPAHARLALSHGNYAEALDIAIRLRLHELVEEVIETIPANQIDFLARQLPVRHVIHYMIPFLARQLDGRSRHLEFYVHWTDSILRAHGLALRCGAVGLAMLDPPNKNPQNSANVSNSTSVDLIVPKLLGERGEWATCQASLVRLQSSLEHIKTNMIQRFEAVDNLWKYLDNIACIQSQDARLTNPASNNDILDDPSVTNSKVQSLREQRHSAFVSS